MGHITHIIDFPPIIWSLQRLSTEQIVTVTLQYKMDLSVTYLSLNAATEHDKYHK